MAVVPRDGKDLKNRKSHLYASSVGLGVVGIVLLLLSSPLEAAQFAIGGTLMASFGVIKSCKEDAVIRKHWKLADECKFLDLPA